MASGATVEHRIEVSNVDIPPALLGARFSVERDGRLVDLLLPSVDDIGKPEGNPRLQLTGSHTDGDPAKNSYSVSRILFRIPTTGALDLPEHEPQNDSLGFKTMFAVVEETAPIAHAVFNEWTRVIRWKCLNAWLARPEDESSGWRGSLHDADTSERLLGTGSHTSTARWTKISVDAWIEAKQSMQDAVPSPIWFDLALDGQWHRDRGDLRRAVIDTAVACEVFLKSKVLDSLPLARAGLKAHLERASVSVFRERLFPEIIPFGKHSTWDGIKNTLGELFTARNGLMHNGHRELLANDCQRFCAAAQTLLTMM
jgi:hypothetical protein